MDVTNYCRECAAAVTRIEELEDLARRLRRVERDVRNLEETIREQASGSQDGYLLQLADDIRRILA